MNLLITSATSVTAQLIAGELSGTHSLRLTDLPENASGDIVPNELGHESETDELVAGIDAVINIGYQGQSGLPAHLMDYSTRRMYNLLQAAADAGVKRYINISTLRLYEDHEENLVVTEKWRTDPSAENVDLLNAHMAEYVCKEFARDRLIQVVNLRLGWPFNGTGADDTAAISSELIGAAIEAALVSEELIQWQDIHIQSPVAHQRFITNTAARILPGLAGSLSS
ncbi:MAG: NAD(P)-dependent oxidoreductase [Chloroflexi bacterium]|nr:NAD(P)-dependent oxidoreductase [Chloroflexota bacterium]MBT5627328.1 NAD(P)-dependent oxidoreductase [Chloroflexota bacterium]